MSIETPRVSTELVNTGFVDKVFSGRIKEAQEQASLYIRNKLYEDGILRRLFENRVVTADELDPNLDDDQPSIIVEIEPDSPEATFVPFKGTGNSAYFNGKRFRVPFGKVESEREHKAKEELMTIRMPITDWLKEHQVKAIQQEEDKYFFGTVTDCVTKNPTQQDLQVALAGNVTFKEAFVQGIDALTKLRLPVGKVVMNKSTYLKSLELRTDVIGFKPVEDRFNRGIDGEDTFLGVPVVTTIKDDVIKDNEMFFFAPQDYFCKFYLIQDATLFMKTEASMIEFYTYESIGIGIGNTHGVVRVTLQ